MNSTIINGIFLLIGVILGGAISLFTGLLANKSQKQQLRAQFTYNSKVKWLDDLSKCIVQLRIALDGYVNLKLQIHLMEIGEITYIPDLIDSKEVAQMIKKYYHSIGLLAGEYSILLSENSDVAKGLKADIEPFIKDLKFMDLKDFSSVSRYSESLRLYIERVERFIATEKDKLNLII